MSIEIMPQLEAFCSGYQEGKNQLMHVTMPADLETPVSAMLKLSSFSDYHFLFESVQDGERRGRYSIIGLGADLIFKIDGKSSFITRKNGSEMNTVENNQDNPLDVLQGVIDESRIDIQDGLPPMSAGIFGYLGYDTIRLIEAIPDDNPDKTDIADSMFVRPSVMVIFDSAKDMVSIICPVWNQGNNERAEFEYLEKKELIYSVARYLSAPMQQHDYSRQFKEPSTIDFISNTTREGYHDMVNKAKEYIRAGDIFQVVPSQRFIGELHVSGLALYRSLRHLNPSPYMFYLNMKEYSLIGSSPEILVCMQDGEVIGRPIAGTRPRGSDKVSDLQLEKELLSDAKECAEHLMLLDLGRNDIGRVSKVGSVYVKEQFVIERYSHVMHIVSEVRGGIKDGCSETDAIKAAFPVGTVSGAPKIRAMEIIDELETEKRKFYAGGVGYISAGGSVDICIALRTSLLKDSKIYIQAGGGVVADSDPEAEYQETLNKAKALMKAAESACRFE